ncbi:hypothetical protein L1049_013758 [Liquidambar formosana]|uniref:Late embryogenesis abundant protein LEA-2 subgroup domain-containing protein n=1 Tax=Liquidambar formosana TaxID=63359 RepID=A0AAP0WYL7_LIQFO
MADRVHPADSPSSDTASSHNPDAPSKPTPPQPEKPVPPIGTYVIQIPKDQIYRVPPPENARRFEKLTRRKTRRSPCCCCLCWLLSFIALLVVLIAISAGIFYLVVRPKSPKYSVDNVSITGFNISSSLAISPEFDVTVRAENPNKKISIYYEKDSSVNIYYSDVKLCSGVLPVFYQPSKNVTVFQTALSGSGIVLGSTVHETLVNAQNQGQIPFKLKLKAPVRIKVGSVKTWTITVKVSCDITVNKLTADAQILSKDCDFGVKLW